MNTTPESSKMRGNRWAIVGVALFAMLIVLFYAEEDIRGIMAWHKVKRSEEANGENFALAPLLKPALDYGRTTNGVRWRDTNAYQHLTGIRIDLGRGSRNVAFFSAFCRLISFARQILPCGASLI